MSLAYQQSVNFSAARHLAGQWRGDNFTLTTTSTAPLALDVARFSQHEIVLEDGPPTTLNVAGRLWADFRERLGERAGELLSLTLAEEAGVAVTVTASQTDCHQQTNFSAAHRTHAPQLSPAENLALYGKCDNPNGHGHNYQLEVWSPTEIKFDALLQEFDHKNLSLDIPDLYNHNVVTETVARLIAHRLSVASRVRLWETPDFFVETSAADPVFRLGRVYRFNAVQRLGANLLSGQAYQVQVAVQGRLDERTETVYDLGQLDVTARTILDSLNGTCLNDLPFFQTDSRSLIPRVLAGGSSGRMRSISSFQTVANSTSLSNLALYLWGQFQTKLGSALAELQLISDPTQRLIATP
jgi:6-pyruvoyl-tetrahydropterin synthase